MKIVQAVNSMIANKHKINNVIVGRDDEYFFLFGNHKWSVGMNSDGYYLRYFPGPESLEEMAAYVAVPWTREIPVSVLYSTSEIRTREAAETFAEFFRVVKEKLYDVDSVLDEIISGDDF